MSRSVLDFLRDIEESCSRIIRYTDAKDRDRVFGDEILFDALLHNLHVIGEAVKHLPRELRDDHSEIPWNEIAGMRDIIAHAYFSLDLDILWRGFRDDVPELLAKVKQMVAEYSD